MTLTELRYIVAVSQERHFGKAANACFVSQPTLSVAIKKLEDELCVQIFERRSNEVALTQIGEKVIAQAQQTLEAAANIKYVAQSGLDHLDGVLKLGAIYTIGPYLLPDLIPQLSKIAPKMPLVVEENYTAVLTEKLRRGELDVIIVALPYDEQNVELQPLYDEPFVVLLPSSHPLTQHDVIKPAHLENENVLLLGAGHCFRSHVLDACPTCMPKQGQAGELERTFEGSSLETIRHMVASGLGITVLPCTAAGADRYAQRLLTIRQFSQPVPHRTIALAWRTSFPRTKAIHTVQKAIMSCSLSCLKRLH